jgi:hypothetical protein
MKSTNTGAALSAAPRRSLGESWHDPARQGSLRLAPDGDGNKGAALASVADVIRWHTRPGEDMPLSEAVRTVLDRIEATGRPMALSRPNEWGRMVTDADVWRVAKEAAPETWADVDNPFFGYSLFGSAVGAGKPATIRVRVPAVQALLELRGTAGLLGLLRERWHAVRDAEDLDIEGVRVDRPTVWPTLLHSVAFPCLLASDAAELFGYGAEPPQTASVVALRTTSGQVVFDTARHELLGKPPGSITKWTDELLNKLWRQHTWLCEGEAKSAKAADAELAPAWNRGESCISQRRLKAPLYLAERVGKGKVHKVR